MYKSSNSELFRQWERHGQPKIALKTKDDQEMVSREEGGGGAPLRQICMRARVLSRCRLA
jgi:peptidyl-tRNA hydrolase